MLVAELMSAPVLVVAPALPLPDAMHLMKSRGVRRLPVVENGQLVGIVTDRDVREALPSKLTELAPWEASTRAMTVRLRDIMRRRVLTTTPQTQAQVAAEIMLEHSVGALPVVVDGAVIGMITVTDVLRDYVGRATPLGLDISSRSGTSSSANSSCSSSNNASISADSAQL